MRITYAMTEDAYAAAQAHTYARLRVRVGSPLACTAMLVVCWVLVATCFFFWFRSDLAGTPLHFQPTPWAIAAFVAFFVYGTLYNSISFREIRKSFEPYPVEFEIELGDGGVTASSSFGSNFFAWRGFDTIEDTEDYVFLLMRNGWCEPIPVEAFATDQERKEFVEAVRSSLRQSGSVSI